jgi:hypothetical protein
MLDILRCFGHVQRMEENRIRKRVLYMNWGQQAWEVEQETDGKMKWGKDGRIVGGEVWQER